MNQREQILHYLKQGNKLTSWEAIHKFRATRLSAIIYNLKKNGYDIIAVMQTADNGKRYAEYTLISQNKLRELD
jgi:hypothetical protein